MRGKVAGTMMAVAKLERRVKVVRFWMDPPILPAMIGAAVAVGMMKHISSPCAKIGLEVKYSTPAYVAKEKTICVMSSTQCHLCNRRSSGLTLQNVKKSIKNIHHGRVGFRGRKSL